MAIYYVDPENGNALNDGLSLEKPVLSEDSLTVKPGDSVLFKRGTMKRGAIHNVEGEVGNPVTYGAYGEGPMPIICGSVDLKQEHLWTEIRENIWVYTELDDEPGNFIFDGGKTFGTLRWVEEDLKEQGDFYDNCFGCTRKPNPTFENHKIYLYSVKNPALYYDSIECAVCGERVMMRGFPNTNVENLRFLNSGLHGIASGYTSRHMKIRNCIFENIGGGVWSYERRIRFGNAVEFWDIAEDIEITNCVFNNIYDSATTHQGMPDSCQHARDLIICNNLFVGCGMGAYELRNKMPINSKFNNNLCFAAGDGFSKQGETMPRKSEIWPQPMGHHLFIWRVGEEQEGSFEIKNNVFGSARYGAAIYSIIDVNSEKLMDISDNTYCTQNENLINRIGGKDYKTFEEYKALEKGCRYEELQEELMIATFLSKMI